MITKMNLKIAVRVLWRIYTPIATFTSAQRLRVEYCCTLICRPIWDLNQEYMTVLATIYLGLLQQFTLQT